MADTISEAIDELALNPQEIQGDAGRIKEQNLKDVIEADKYQRSVTASASSKSGWLGLRPARVVPPGSIGPRET